MASGKLAPTQPSTIHIHMGASLSRWTTNSVLSVYPSAVAPETLEPLTAAQGTECAPRGSPFMLIKGISPVEDVPLVQLRHDSKGARDQERYGLAALRLGS